MITSPLPFKEKGRPVLDLALVGLVYFRNGHTAVVRAGIAAFLREYFALCGPQLQRWFASNNTDERLSYKSVDGNTVSAISSVVANAAARAPWEFSVEGGDEPGDATQYLLECSGAASWQQDMGRQGTLYFRLPWDWYVTREGSFAELFHRACFLAPPNHGHGGFGFGYSSQVNKARSVELDIFFIANIRPAFVVEDFIFDTLNLEKGTREGNWLTALHDDWMARIGGAEQIIAALGPDFTCRRYPGGMTIQAGDEPDPIGPSIHRAPPEIDPDAVPPPHPPLLPNAAQFYPLYHRLNTVLRPLRVSSEDFKGGLQSGQDAKGEPYFDHERSMAWMARFD